jgi:hypothetical protein
MVYGSRVGLAVFHVLLFSIGIGDGRERHATPWVPTYFWIPCETALKAKVANVILDQSEAPRFGAVRFRFRLVDHPPKGAVGSLHLALSSASRLKSAGTRFA